MATASGNRTENENECYWGHSGHMSCRRVPGLGSWRSSGGRKHTPVQLLGLWGRLWVSLFCSAVWRGRALSLGVTKSLTNPCMPTCQQGPDCS